MPDASAWLAIAAILALLGGLSALLAPTPLLRHRLGYGFAALASGTAMLGAAIQFLNEPPLVAELYRPLPYLAFTLRIDSLSALFIGLTGLLGLAVSIYAQGYAAEYIGRKHVGALASLFNVFLLSMAMVPAVNDALAFLLVWEIMAVSSFFLVAFEHEKEATRRATLIYAVMTQIGTACLLGAFLLLATHSQGLSFDAFRQAPAMTPWLKDLAFLGFFVGFAAKSGVFPLHGWLPEAHPAAPSHVSALMSAVMIKTGLYGILRVSFDLLGDPVPWWGALLLGLGAVSAVLGALGAVMETDLKRLLAQSSIENVGIMLLGLGAALYFQAHHHPKLAALALVAGLYHLINHACFKGMLFCGAGAVLSSTHTAQLDRLGGLIRRMPQTTALVLLGTMAIAALPPLNGFVSEWLIFQSLFSGAQLGPLIPRLTFPLLVSALALAGGLALTAFVKAFGVAFLAKPRSDEATHAHEASSSMRVGMGLLGAACLALGVLPGFVVPQLSRVAEPLVGSPAVMGNPWTLAASGSTLSMPTVWLILLTVGVMVFACWGAGRVRRAKTWGCGLPLSSRTQYTAMGYAQPLRSIFGHFLVPHAQQVHDDATLPPYFKREMRYQVHMTSLIDTVLYRPVSRAVMGAMRQVTRIQTGSVHLYLAYILVSLLLALLLMKGLG